MNSWRDEEEEEEQEEATENRESEQAWVCPRCTFENELVAASCVICEEPRVATAWACPHCTLENLGTAISCVACEAPRVRPSDSQSCAAPTGGRIDIAATAWPALSGVPSVAKPRGDAASISSSWLDLAEEQDLGEDDMEDWSIASENLESLDSWSVVSGTKDADKEPQAVIPAIETSWAARAARAAQTAQPTALGQLAVSARFGWQHARKETPAQSREVQNDDEDDELEQLEGRRLNPGTRRGATQRRRLGDKSKGRSR